MMFSGTKYSEEITTTPFLSMQQDPTILFITQDYEMTKAVYYRIMYEKGLGKFKANMCKMKEEYLEWLAGVTGSEQDDVDVIAFSNAYTELCEKLKGKKHSAESRDKISEAMKDKKHSAESRDKMSKAMKGKKHSAESRDKISEAMEGKKN